MSTRLRKCMTFIELVVNSGKVSPVLARSLLDKAKSEQALCIIELIVNTLQGNLEISEEFRYTLVKSRAILRKLSFIEDQE